MCPSDIFQIPASDNFGPVTEIFVRDVQYPCSIAIREKELAGNVKIQIQKDDEQDWKDYEEGDLLIGKTIKCRLAYKGGSREISIEVFHT